MDSAPCMLNKPSKSSVNSRRRVGCVERSETQPTRRPARDRSRLGPQVAVAELDPGRSVDSQSEQSLGPPPATPPTATPGKSPHSQDRNHVMDDSQNVIPTAATPQKPKAFVGIDLAKLTFQAALVSDGHPGFNVSLGYSADGIEALLSHMKPFDVELIGME